VPRSTVWQHPVAQAVPASIRDNTVVSYCRIRTDPKQNNQNNRRMTTRNHRALIVHGVSAQRAPASSRVPHLEALDDAVGRLAAVRDLHQRLHVHAMQPSRGRAWARGMGGSGYARAGGCLSEHRFGLAGRVRLERRWSTPRVPEKAGVGRGLPGAR
jgi:hypothetical protein